MQSVIAVFGTAWGYTSAAEILSSGNAEGANVMSIAIYFCVSTSYLCWGFIRRDSIIVLGSLIGLVGNIFLLISIFIVTHS
jgi:hypothetical protein